MMNNYENNTNNCGKDNIMKSTRKKVKRIGIYYSVYDNT